MSKWSVALTAAVLIASGLMSPARAQQSASALNLAFSAQATSPAGPVQASGDLRIVQFFEQNGQLFAVGTLTVGLGEQAAAAGTALSSTGTATSTVRTVVTQVVLPVVAMSSGSTSAILSFTGNSAPATMGMTSGVGILGSAGTTSNTNGTFATPASTAGVPSSAVPGQVANCGPLHVEVGPVDLNQRTLTLHLDRLVLDITAPSGTATTLNSFMCSVDAALAQSAGAGTSIGAAQPISSAGTTTAIAGTIGATTTAPARTPMQNLVDVLNRLLVVL